MRATYSPEDNKLRLYPSERLGAAEYKRFKTLGFRWAPRQELFVAPMWTPRRFDLLIEFCGEVEDEDTSLVQRSEDRAERFEGYSENRAADANAVHKAVDSITQHIPLGQPILVGHHSEKHARKDAERIENGMKKAVSMWETSKYWEYRAAGALHAAKYKERPDVRARRIKKLGAEMRKRERDVKASEANLNLWNSVDLSQEKAELIAGGLTYSYDFYCEIRDKKITPEEGKERAVKSEERGIKYAQRWIEHYQNRIVFETAMLNEQGAGDLLKPKARPKHPPICNYDGKITLAGMYGNAPQTLTMHHMSKAEYSAKPSDYRGCRYAADGSHRVRIALIGSGRGATYSPIFLTDSKVHDVPEAPELEPPKTPQPALEPREIYQPPERTVFDDMKDRLETGIEVVSAPGLFVTPHALAERMVDLVDIGKGSRVLEPSAGTGVIVKAISEKSADITAVEINPALVSSLIKMGVSGLHVYEGDFLDFESLKDFDAVIMNPPFANADDIKHILYALTCLKEGGRLVAICADGPRQNDKLKSLALESGGTWEKLPAGTFKEAGTNVNTALLTIYK